MQTPPRTILEIDIDARDPRTGTRLLRYKTTRYLAHEQRAEIRFLYDRFPSGDHVDRSVSDFDCHVYYPREVELLFRLTGFSMQDDLAHDRVVRPVVSGFGRAACHCARLLQDDFVSMDQR